MSAPLSAIGIDPIDTGSHAFFLDFDGTLAEIAERPDLVHLAPGTRQVIAGLAAAADGALAVITGRDIAEIDAILSPLKLPVAGVHGLSRRGADGRTTTQHIDAAALDRLSRRLQTVVTSHAGLDMELKSGSIALHYRARPELAALCARAMEESIDGEAKINLLRGKMVIEAKAGDGHKGTAVAAFLGEPPFAGRVPVYAGDDVTDEDAFEEVNRRGGITIKIGSGDTGARYRARDSAGFLDWLARIAKAEGGNLCHDQP